METHGCRSGSGAALATEDPTRRRWSRVWRWKRSPTTWRRRRSPKNRPRRRPLSLRMLLLNHLTRLSLSSGHHWRSSCTLTFTFTLTSLCEGLVYSWGLSNDGRLGLPKAIIAAACLRPGLVRSAQGDHAVTVPCHLEFRTVRMISVSAGESYSFAIDRKGALFSWGCNREGQREFNSPQDRCECVCAAVRRLDHARCVTMRVHSAGQPSTSERLM